MPDYWPGSDHFVAPAEGTAVAIGNFDGVHRGHCTVLDGLKKHATAFGVASVVYTFDPAPTAVVAPTRHQPRIQTLEARVSSLLDAGVDDVVVEPFTRALAQVPAAEFATEYLGRRLNAKVVVVGPDFRFGHGRAGNAEHLREWLPNTRVEQLSAQIEGDEPISSSRIRKLIAAGEVEAARRMLGYPYRLSGPVVVGDQRGRTLGFPTANVRMQEELRPGPGVYAARIVIDSHAHLAAVNIGTRPTVDGTRFSVEAHVLDFCGDLYGKHVAVRLLSRIRSEQKFSGLNELKMQIALDVETVRHALT